MTRTIIDVDGGGDDEYNKMINNNFESDSRRSSKSRKSNKSVITYKSKNTVN